MTHTRKNDRKTIQHLRFEAPVASNNFESRSAGNIEEEKCNYKYKEK